MRKRAFFIMASAWLSLMLASASWGAEPKVLRLAFGPQMDNPYGAGGQKFQAEVQKRLGDRFKVELFPDSALGGDRETIEAIQLGTLDLTICNIAVTANFVKDMTMLTLPFLFRDEQHVKAFLASPMAAEMFGQFPKRDMIVLAPAFDGFRMLTNNKRSVHTLADLKGLKIRTMENKSQIEGWKSLGVLPTPMAFPEVYTALQQGAIDGQDQTTATTISNKFYEIQKYMTYTNHTVNIILVMMSPNVYNPLSEADKKTFREIGAEAAGAIEQKWREVEDQGIAFLRSKGVEVVTEIDRPSFDAAVAPLYKDFSKTYGDRLTAIREMH